MWKKSNMLHLICYFWTLRIETFNRLTHSRVSSRKRRHISSWIIELSGDCAVREEVYWISIDSAISTFGWPFFMPQLFAASLGNFVVKCGKSEALHQQQDSFPWLLRPRGITNRSFWFRKTNDCQGRNWEQFEILFYVRRDYRISQTIVKEVFWLF